MLVEIDSLAMKRISANLALSTTSISQQKLHTRIISHASIASTRALFVPFLFAGGGGGGGGGGVQGAFAPQWVCVLCSIVVGGDASLKRDQ